MAKRVDERDAVPVAVHHQLAQHEVARHEHGRQADDQREDLLAAQRLADRGRQRAEVHRDKVVVDVGRLRASVPARNSTQPRTTNRNVNARRRMTWRVVLPARDPGQPLDDEQARRCTGPRGRTSMPPRARTRSAGRRTAGWPDVRHLRAAVAADRDVDVVAKPARQRHVPAAPEVGHRHRRVGPVEVLREAEPEHPAPGRSPCRCSRRSRSRSGP